MLQKLQWDRKNGDNTMKRNYPKDRKSDPNSATQTLLTTVGHDRLYKLWAKHGMYKTAKLLSEELNWWVSEYVIRYMSNKYNWQRTVTDKNLPVYKGVLNGRVKPEYYKHIKFA